MSALPLAVQMLLALADAGNVVDAGVVAEVVKEAVVEAPKGAGASILDGLLSPSVIGLIFGVLASILTGLKILNDQRKKVVAIATQHAYNIVNDIAANLQKSGAKDVLDKVAKGLESANAWMVANGWRPLSARETEAVKLGFQAIHGATKAPQANP